MGIYAFIEWSNWFLVVIAALTAWAVWIQARETRRSAEATRSSVEAIRQETMIVNRAYLAVGDPTVFGHTASFPLWNYGSIAARVTVVEGELIVQDFQDKVTYRRAYRQPVDIVVLPGEPHKGACTLDFVLPDEAREDHVVISAKAIYSTGFNKTDELEFIRVYFPTENKWSTGHVSHELDFSRDKQGKPIQR